MRNNIIAYNTTNPTSLGGGGVFIRGTQGRFINNTIAYNHSNDGGGIIPVIVSVCRYTFKNVSIKNLLRRDRDSNPGRTCILNGFQDRRIQPLCHLSGIPIAGILGYKYINTIFYGKIQF
jgi:hypothetical protein